MKDRLLICMVLVVGFIVADAWAVPAPLDLDTVSYFSDVVVEGRFIALGGESFRITAVLAGPVAAGQIIVIKDARDYTKPVSSFVNEFLGPEDHLLLMLRRKGATGNVFEIVDSAGVKLLVRGRVCDFVDDPFVDNRLRYMAQITAAGSLYSPMLSPPPLNSLASVADYRKKLEATIRKTSAWRKQFDVPVDSKDLPPQFRPASLAPRSPPLQNAPPQQGVAIFSKKQSIFATGALTALPAALLLRAMVRSRRQRVWLRRQRCPRCGYDLRVATAACPECGRLAGSPLDRRIILRCAARMLCMACVILVVAIAAIWVRSYRTVDCLTRTAPDRVDSCYVNRGRLSVQLHTIEGPAGWSYDRGEPSSFPRSIAECADPDGLSWHGIEHSFAAGIVVIPLGWPAGVSGALAGLLMAWLRRQRRKYGR